MSFHVKTKWIIGLTGSMLSGKSTALSYFAKQGVDAFSCDEMVRELYANPRVLKAIEQLMGTTDKAKIAALIFKNKAKRMALENLLHPLILKEVGARIKKSKRPVIVVEAPLLFEAGWDAYTDLNIVVLAAPKTLSARLKSRKITRAEYNQRTRQQWPDLQKAQRADVVFYHATKAQLKKSVEQFCSVLEVLPHQ